MVELPLNKLLKDGYPFRKKLSLDRLPKKDMPFLCDKINESLTAIKSFDWESLGLAPYEIKETFTVENSITKGDVGPGLPGAYVEHDMFNHLHRHFENLQGQVRSIFHIYRKKANKEIRWHIRQLNLLCPNLNHVH